jgi:hypothetical protein
VTTIDRTWLKEHSELGVCALLALTGLLVLVDSLLGTDAGSRSDPLGPHAVPLVLGVLLAGMGLFWGAAYTLGSRRPVADPLIAGGVSLATWILFDPLLGVDLPGGPLMGLF